MIKFVGCTDKCSSTSILPSFWHWTNILCWVIIVLLASTEGCKLRHSYVCLCIQPSLLALWYIIYFMLTAHDCACRDLIIQRYCRHIIIQRDQHAENLCSVIQRFFSTFSELQALFAYWISCAPHKMCTYFLFWGDKPARGRRVLTLIHVHKPANALSVLGMLPGYTQQKPAFDSVLVKRMKLEMIMKLIN